MALTYVPWTAYRAQVVWQAGCAQRRCVATPDIAHRTSASSHGLQQQRARLQGRQSRHHRRAFDVSVVHSMSALLKPKMICERLRTASSIDPSTDRPSSTATPPRKRLPSGRSTNTDDWGGGGSLRRDSNPRELCGPAIHVSVWWPSSMMGIQVVAKQHGHSPL